MKNNLPLIVIVGPTASGKTALAIKLAKRYGGEIICADSRTIYKGLDIGTAKPTLAERATVPHWGLDLVEPGDYFSVADFKEYALKKIEEIRLRGKIPFLVGGSGLYIDSVIFDFNFGKNVDKDVRKILNSLTLTELREHCNKNNIKLPENDKNRRYVIRAIENFGSRPSKLNQPIEGSIIVGMMIDKTELRTRIEKRSEQLFNDGVVEEARILGKKYGWGSEALKGNVYPLAHAYLQGKIDFDEMKMNYSILDWRLAKRQITWFKRNKYIKWLSPDEASVYISNLLAKPA